MALLIGTAGHVDHGKTSLIRALTRIDADHVGIVYEGSQSHLVFEKIALVELLQPAVWPAVP